MNDTLFDLDSLSISPTKYPSAGFPINVVGEWSDFEVGVMLKAYGSDTTFSAAPKIKHFNIIHSGVLPLPSGRFCGDDQCWYFCVPSSGDTKDIRILESFKWAVQASVFVHNGGKNPNMHIKTELDDDMLYSIQNGHEFSMDIETTSLEPMEGSVVRCGICRMSDEKIYVAEGASKSTLLMNILAEEGTPLVMCNSKFEMKWGIHLLNKCFNVSGDVQVHSALLNEEGHKGLEYLSMQVGMAGYDLPMTDYLRPLRHKDGKQVGERSHHTAPSHLLTEYNALDCLVTARVMKKQRIDSEKEAGNFKAAERVLLSCQRSLAEMELCGMKLDTSSTIEQNRQLVAAVNKSKNDIEKIANNMGVDKFSIGNPQHRVNLLRMCGVKVNSSAKDVLGALSDKVKNKNPLIRSMLDYQRDSSLLSGIMTYCMQGVAKDGYLRTNFDCTSLVTGQLSSYKPPMLNIAKGPIRSVFVSRFKEKGAILELDYSQLHLRIMGNIANCKSFIDSYNNGIDLHAVTGATCVLNITTEEMLTRLDIGDKEAKDARQLGKRINFGIITEISEHGLSNLANISKNNALILLRNFYRNNPEIFKLQQDQHKFVVEHGYVVSPTGRVRHLPDAKTTKDEYERGRLMRQATDYLISNPGRTTTIIGMNMMKHEMRDRGMESLIINQVHDSVVHDVMLDELDELLKLAVSCYVTYPMMMLPTLYDKIRLVMDGKLSEVWGGGRKEDVNVIVHEGGYKYA